MKTSEILNKAADLIQQRGWADRNHPTAAAWGEGSDTSPVCLEGGIIAAMGAKTFFAPVVEVEECPAYKAVHGYLELPDSERIYVFNDARDRTAEEVIEVLRACALIEQAREDSSIEAPVEVLEVTW